MKMAEEAARFSHQGKTGINFKELADEMGLDFEEELGRALAELLRNREDIAMAEYVPLCVDFQPDLVIKPKPLQTMQLMRSASRWIGRCWKAAHRFICINTVGRQSVA